MPTLFKRIFITCVLLSGLLQASYTLAECLTAILCETPEVLYETGEARLLQEKA